MSGFTITRKTKPRKTAKCLIDYFTQEDKEFTPTIACFIGVFMPMKRAEIEKLGESYEVYSRDAQLFKSNKELKQFKKDYC